MNSIIKIFVLQIIVICSSSNLIAQKQILVNNEPEFKRLFVAKVIKYNDTISNYVKNSGTLFMKFLLNAEGGVDSVKCSEKQPKHLIKVLTESLMTFKFPLRNASNEKDYYVLPIMYDYLPDFTPKQLLDDPNILAPKIDIGDFDSYINFDFNGLFKIAESEKALWGINCVLLPPIKVGLTRVYQHNSQKPISKEKTKDKMKLQPNIR